MKTLTVDRPINRVFFTADTHFGHKNIIKYSERPFVDALDMDRALIRNWNSVVGKRDIVFHLGDFGFGSKITNETLLKQLNGEIHFVLGNHDGNHPYNGAIPDRIDLRCHTPGLGSVGIILDHYAMRVWDRSHHGVLHLYGHSHGSLPDDPHSLSMDVGVDSIAKILSNGGERKPDMYRPVSLEWVLERMKLKQFTPVDHHR